MKKIILTLGILLIAFSAFAAPFVTVKGAYAYSVDTNIASTPLVKSGDNNYLQYRTDNPYLSRLNNGLRLASEMYFSPKGRFGLSFAFDMGKAYNATEYVPSSTDSSKDWNYVESDALERQKLSFFFSGGVSFRAVLNHFDLGVNLRASLGSYDSFDGNIILGLVTEAFVNYFITDNLFLSSSFTLDTHFMYFYLDNPNNYYLKNYLMMNISGSIGFGYSFGARGNK
jgi:hypothetical protein